MPLARSGWLRPECRRRLRARSRQWKGRSFGRPFVFLEQCLKFKHRHGRACPGQPCSRVSSLSWMAATRAAKTIKLDLVITLYSIGHSNRSFADFLALLKANGVKALADIRQFTRSRANPQFNADTFAPKLAENGIAYEHITQLGGRRSSKLEDSPNA